MKMEKYKNHILFSLIALSEVHTLFRGLGNIVWELNGVEKTFSLSTFLFVKHITTFVLYYILINPKGVNKNLLYFCFILSGLDIIHFIVLSGFDFEVLKLFLAFLILFTYKLYKKWLSCLE